MHGLARILRGARFVLIGIAASMASSGEVRAQLIVNGSFEQPLVVVGSYIDFLGGSNAIPGWTVVGVDSAIVSGSFTQSGIVFEAQAGSQFADLTGTASNSQTSGLSQIVPTVVGQTYQLQFHVGSAQGGGLFFPATIDLSIDGGPRVSYTNPAAPTIALDWRQFNVTFAATSTSTRLTFYNGGAANNYNSALDNVSLTAITTDMIGKIAFTSSRDGNDEIYVMNSDGSGQTRLTNNPARDTYAAWSPNGTQIAFQSDRDGNDEIYVMNSDGTNQTRLTNDGAHDVTPAWSPDGVRIAFGSNRAGGGILVMNADGTNPVGLTSIPASLSEPAWSPDGTRIAFASYFLSPGVGDIYVMNADGSNVTNLTKFSAPIYAGLPIWSPDGDQIAFDKFTSVTRIFVMNNDGSGQTALTSGSNDVRPAWSPTGTRIAFERRDLGEIAVVNTYGSGQIPLTDGATQDGLPTWQFGTVPEPGIGVSLMSGLVLIAALGSRGLRSPPPRWVALGPS